MTLASCEVPRTQLLVGVDTDFRWGAGAQVQSVSLEVRRGGAGGALRDLRVTALGTGVGRRALPLWVTVLSADDGDTSPLWIEALACAGVDGCTRDSAIGKQRASVVFVRGRTAVLELVLAQSCAASRCALTERCDVATGRCVDVEDQADVRAYTGSLPGRAATDAGAVDGGARSDAGTACPAGMVVIPAGTFPMGDGDATDAGTSPVHAVTLGAYCMDLTEVTVAAYRACAASGCTSPGTGTAFNWGAAGRDEHPVNGVDWNQARAYCQWRGGDLPTEAQWEHAARGNDPANHVYPWGNDAPASQLCWNRYPTPATTCPVGFFAAGTSPFGLADMAGNVWEWTLDWYGPYATPAVNPTGPSTGSLRVYRGGSWYTSAAGYVRAGFRNTLDPTVREPYVGFRCVRRVM